MDILNFISWIRGRRQVTTVDPAKTLLPVGIKDPKRDDEYLAGAITVEDFAASIVTPPAYKVYTALLTQTGTDAPVATVLENTIGNITFGYTAPGNYTINSSGLFELNKTFILNQAYSGYDGSISIVTTYLNSSQIILGSLNLGTPSNGLIFTPTSIEIRVYN